MLGGVRLPPRARVLALRRLVRAPRAGYKFGRMSFEHIVVLVTCRAEAEAWAPWRSVAARILWAYYAVKKRDAMPVA